MTGVIFDGGLAPCRLDLVGAQELGTDLGLTIELPQQRAILHQAMDAGTV
jgi:hypothetical protein